MDATATQETVMRNPPLPTCHAAPDPRLERMLRRMLFAGAALVVVLPAARGSSTWLGALPLWLLAMPAVSLWALHRFRLPHVARPPSNRRRRAAQARRRSATRHLPGLRRAA
jgi:hypothetical protein